MSTTPVMVVNKWNCSYCCDQQSHMITHLTGISAPGYLCIPVTPVETGTVLHGFGKLKPIPVPVHTISILSQVYPYPCHALPVRGGGPLPFLPVLLIGPPSLSCSMVLAPPCCSVVLLIIPHRCPHPSSSGGHPSLSSPSFLIQWSSGCCCRHCCCLE